MRAETRLRIREQFRKRTKKRMEDRLAFVTDTVIHLLFFRNQVKIIIMYRKVRNDNDKD